MSEAIAFDTHRYVKRLTESGFTERQAETLAEEQIALLNANLATKADIEAVKVEFAKVEAGLKVDIEAVKAEIAKVEAGLKVDIEAVKVEIAKVDKRIETVKSDLLKWMFAGLIAQGGVIVALLQLLK